MPGIDYSKFDKLDVSDDEDYDAYLRKRYGVTSGWRPGCGMQPPVLGGRTPGEPYEECELEPLGDFELPTPTTDAAEQGVTKAPAADASFEAEATARAATPRGSRRICGRCFCALVRLAQILAWMIPIVMTVMHLTLQAIADSVPSSMKAQVLSYANGDENIRLETFVYPAVVSACLVMGLLDALVAAVAPTRSEGPAAVAFACWFKRAYLSLSFLAYEAMYTSSGGMVGGMPMRTASGVVMISAWTVRKVWGYSQDLVGLFNYELHEATTGKHVPGGQATLFLEALTELIFLLVHLSLMPSGTRFFGYKMPGAIWACGLSVMAIGNVIAFRKSAINTGPAEKGEHKD